MPRKRPVLGLKASPKCAPHDPFSWPATVFENEAGGFRRLWLFGYCVEGHCPTPFEHITFPLPQQW